jgi:hypothetical protein
MLPRVDRATPTVGNTFSIPQIFLAIVPMRDHVNKGQGYFAARKALRAS